jgi:hypothetical protein
MRAMEKVPGERPQSAREVIKALDDYAALRPPLARWQIAALVGVVLLLLAAAIMLREPILNWVHRFVGG